MPGEDLASLLDFLQEPAFLLADSGEVLRGNRAALRLTGIEVAGRHMIDLSASPADEVRAYLRRCSGVTSPLPGSLTLRDAVGGTPRYRVYGARLRGAEARLGLRCVPAETGEFSVLARKVRELNAEIHSRRQIQAGLEEALRRNETLLRELHHRVKNNIQLMLGLFSAAQRDTSSPEVKTFLVDARQRLMAIGTVQNLMYQSQQMRTVRVGALLEALCASLGAAFRSAGHIEVLATDAEVSNEIAFPLSLIVNELVTNAFKHGCIGAEGIVRVSLTASGRNMTLIVEDGGPGFREQEASRRASGLGLVRGLCHQLGGSFEVEQDGSTRCIVRIADATLGEAET